MLASAALIGAQADAAGSLPVPDAGFAGKVDINSKDSTPDWPKLPAAPKGAPNIVIVLLDDAGFSSNSVFGGPVQTPAIEQLASQGLRYNNFNTTALCSPTRAALLTGRNHHRVGFGTVVDIGSGYPGYNGVWKKSTVSVAEVLRQNGYSTAAFGKWHNTPSREISAAGPFDHWPTSLGFEYFYGFMAGEASQWEPPLYRNTTPVEPSGTPETGYHITTDLADDAIRWLHTHESLTPDKPYLLYFAPGAVHAPHHVAEKWIAQYRGKFDQGWDKLRVETFKRQKKLGVIPANAKLTPRAPELPGWDSLSADQKRLFARQMEVYAGFLAQTDYEVGRVLDTVHQTPQADNTLILYITGDNGGSAEGGLEGSENNVASFFVGVPDEFATQLQHIDELGSVLHDNHYATAWGWATSAPFQWTKQVASHFGGTRNGMVVSWPARIKDKGGLRQQFTHVTDIAPTLYEATGIALPDSVNGIAQQPIDGTSLEYSFDDAKAPSQHHLQYFEMLGNRALYQDGWVAAVRHSLPWDNKTRNEDFTQDRWELYHVAEDFTEAKDLAAKYPDKLKELQALFEQQARANDVYPFSNGVSVGGTSNRQSIPKLTDGKRQFLYHGDFPRTPTNAAPMLLGSHRITARISIPDAGAEGLIVSDGGRYGGYALYIKDDHLVYDNNFLDHSLETIRSTTSLPRGSVEIAYEFTRDAAPGLAGGLGRLYINGQPAGEGRLSHVGPASNLGSFDIGQAYLSPVSPAYAVPFKFTGTIDTVAIDLK